MMHACMCHQGAATCDRPLDPPHPASGTPCRARAHPSRAACRTISIVRMGTRMPVQHGAQRRSRTGCASEPATHAPGHGVGHHLECPYYLLQAGGQLVHFLGPAHQPRLHKQLASLDTSAGSGCASRSPAPPGPCLAWCPATQCLCRRNHPRTGRLTERQQSAMHACVRVTSTSPHDVGENAAQLQTV